MLRVNQDSEAKWHDPSFVLEREFRRKSAHSRSKLERKLLRESTQESPSDFAEYISPGLAFDLELEVILGAHRGPKKQKKGDPSRALPVAFDERGEFHPAVSSRMSARQADHAHLLLENGLASKARRHAWCGNVGQPLDCTEHSSHRFFRRHRCYLRYCPTCGPLCFRELFDKHVRLSNVVERLLQHRPGDHRRRVLAKLDLTTKNLGRMPTRDEIRRFNKDVRRFFRAIERRFGISRKAYGALWCVEFGRMNTNLHAHAVYCGPWLPQSKLRKELSGLWSEIRGERSFCSIKPAGSFEMALGHALKYPSKFFDAPARRLVELEVAFDRVRRVHAVAAFYNPKIEREPGEEGPQEGCCPYCHALLGEPRKGWAFVDDLQKEGRSDLEEVRTTALARFAAYQERVHRVLLGSSPP